MSERWNNAPSDDASAPGPRSCSGNDEEDATSRRRKKKPSGVGYSSFIEAIGDWLRICDDEHACVESVDGNGQDVPSQQGPSWLIDVEDQCIVRGNGQPYITLSYTWADARAPPSTETEAHKPLQLDHDTNSVLERPGSLSTRDVLNKLPKVIRDAIELTPMIGQRYLWIDRLCIAQGEPTTMSEVSRMDEIYSSARVTLVAAAEHGLYDTLTLVESHSHFNRPNFRQAGRFPPRLIRPKNRDHSLKMHYEAIASSRWAKRAWTYQEHILSKRIIFFLGDRIFWECQTSIWDMHGLAPRVSEGPDAFTGKSNHETAIDLGNRLVMASGPDFSLYIDLICPYNGRQLTFPGDGISACSGILNRLRAAFLNGFFYGLPRDSELLDCALLWQPMKRICYRREGLATGTQHLLPSWSWCGWECFVDPRSLLPGISPDDATSLQAGTSWRVQNLVTWEALGQYGIKSPIPGCHKMDNMLPQLITSAEQAFFHTAVTLQVSAIRICDHTTEHRKAFGHPFLTDTFLAETPLIAVMTDKNGALSGLLRITGDIECLRGDVLELVAISKGSASRADMEKSLEEMIFRNSRYSRASDASGQDICEASSPEELLQEDSPIFTPSFDSNGQWIGELESPRCCGRSYQVETKGDYSPDIDLTGQIWDGKDICNFYNVLWIRRENGIAYRMGCGRVAEETWVKNKSGKAEVVLG